jgi:hypothetical protein
MTIGLIPCGGTATRIQGLPKFLLPIPDGYLLGNLISRMTAVNAMPVIGVSPDNAAIVGQYKKNAFVHTAKDYKTMSETVLSCRAFCPNDEDVVFGMPDTYTEDDGVFGKLLAALDDGAHVAVALFRSRAGQHLKAGMCDTIGNQIHSVVDKPVNVMHFTHLWGALAWSTVFWDYIRPEDAHIGFALPRAIKAGLDVRAVKCDGGYWDCGTYSEYAELTYQLSKRLEPAEMTARL